MIKKIMSSLLAISLIAGASSAFASVRSYENKIFDIPSFANDARGLSQINDNPAASGNPITGIGTTALTHSGTYTLKVTLTTSVTGTQMPTASHSTTGTVALAQRALGPNNSSAIYAASSTHQVYLNGTLKASASTSCTW